MRFLVLGLGNSLLGDEGVGIHAVNALAIEDCPHDVKILSVETAILDALPALEKADYVIIVDAMKVHRAPGTIYRIRLKDCDFGGPVASLHGLDIGRVLALSNRETLPEVVVIGVEPAIIHWSLELSPAVENALPNVLTAVKTEIARSRPFGPRPASAGFLSS